MLRLTALALLLSNLLYFAWSEGWLRVYGMGPNVQREPQRVVQQIQPEVVRVLTAVELSRVEAQVQADLAPKECLQAGPFDDAQVQVLRNALESVLGTGAWQINTVAVPARWIIYMGKFANPEALAKKRSELQAMRLPMQGLTNPSLEPGLSLGSFESQALANAELSRMAARGIRTARVVLERPESQASQLRLPAVSEVLKQRLTDLRPALAGKPIVPCG